MPKGGARARSGPHPDPSSRTSERKRSAVKTSCVGQAAGGAQITTSEFNPMALPAGGRQGSVPDFPLPVAVRYTVGMGEGGKPFRVASEVLTAAFRERELEIWAELWSTPQAVAWEREPYRWTTIAKYCRIMTSTEAEPDASAALLSRERELRIECGLTADGLKINGWAIAPDQLAERRAERSSAVPAKNAAEPVRRLRG